MKFSALFLVLLLSGCRTQTMSECIADRATEGMSNATIARIRAACEDKRRSKARPLTDEELGKVTGKAWIGSSLVPDRNEFKAELYNGNDGVEILEAVLAIDGRQYRVQTTLGPLSAGEIGIFAVRQMGEWEIVSASGIDIR